MTVRISLRAGTALVALCALPHHVLASEAVPAISAHDDTIVVTATRDAAPLAAVPVSISVVSADQIRDQPGRELDDTLRALPGIDLMGYAADTQHPTSNSIGMRGLGGGAQGISRALVMVDGVPINDGYFGYAQWSRVPLDDIARVEVVRGGGSPLWGNYAEGGVINIITETPKGNALTLDAGGGSYGAYRAGASAALRTSASNVLQAFVGANGESGYQAVPDYERAPFNRPTSSHALNARLKDSLELPGDLSASFVVDYHLNHQQLQTLLDSNRQRNIDLAANVTKQFSADAKLALSLFYGNGHFSTNNSTYFPDQANLAATTQALNEIHAITENETGGSLIFSQKFTGALRSVMLGSDWHYIEGTDDTQHFVAPDFSATQFATTSGGHQLFLGGFFQLGLAPLQGLDITASGRVQYLHNTHGYDGSLGGLGAVPDNTTTRFTPRINARYALPGGFALRGAWYQSFRAPNISDQFYGYAAGGFAFLPNPLLSPEKLNGGEVGLDYVRSNLRAQLTFYRTGIDNYIVTEPTNNPIYTPNGWYTVDNQNIAHVRAQGIEAEVDWKLGHDLSARLAYTFADSIVRSNPADPASVGLQVVDVPRHSGSATLTYAPAAGWRLSAQVLAVGRTAWASSDHTDPGYPGKISADPYAVVNLSGSYPVTHRLAAYVQIQNLFDHRYVVTSYSAPSPQAYGTPFEVFAGLRFRM